MEENNKEKNVNTEFVGYLNYEEIICLLVVLLVVAAVAAYVRFVK